MNQDEKEARIVAAVSELAKAKDIIVDQDTMVAYAKLSEADYEDDGCGSIRPTSGFALADHIDMVRNTGQYRWAFRSQRPLDDFDRSRLAKLSASQRLDWANARKK
jgi:hypothetical protein